MNVLFCTLDYFPGVTGGAERQARLQAEELTRRGHRVTVVCPQATGLQSGTIGGVHINRLRHIRRRPWFRLSYLARLFAWLVRHAGEYDVVHVHLANLQADVAVLGAHLHRRPCYVKVACGGSVGEVQRLGRVSKLWRWYGLRHADRVQVLSAEIKAELAGVGVRDERMVKIPNGVDLTGFHAVSAAERLHLRSQLGLPERALMALFAGRLVSYKGIYDLLEAWELVRIGTARLLVVGARGEDEIAPAPGVIVRPWTDSPLRYMQAADLFAHPSHADGMSNAVLEAMACGCPVVATEHGATAGFLRSGHDALLVPRRDPARLATALERLLADAELRSRLASNARETAQRHAISFVVDGIEREYRALHVNAPREDLDLDPPPGLPADQSLLPGVGLPR